MGENNKNRQTHYDVLNLPEDCSAHDVRNAFVKLSKSCHPDANPNDKNLHARFIEINEAYSILSKPDLRQSYDLTLSFDRSNRHRFNINPAAAGTNEYYEDRQKIRRDPSIWEWRDKSKDRPYDPYAYYGLKGVKRVGNGWIAAGAMFVMFVGALFHVATLNTSTSVAVRQLDERDKALSMKLYLVRKAAMENGNERQLEILQEKLEKADADRTAGS